MGWPWWAIMGFLGLWVVVGGILDSLDEMGFMRNLHRGGGHRWFRDPRCPSCWKGEE